jgi:hypothetical protein
VNLLQAGHFLNAPDPCIPVNRGGGGGGGPAGGGASSELNALQVRTTKVTARPTPMTMSHCTFNRPRTSRATQTTPTKTIPKSRNVFDHAADRGGTVAPNLSEMPECVRAAVRALSGGGRPCRVPRQATRLQPAKIVAPLAPAVANLLPRWGLTPQSRPGSGRWYVSRTHPRQLTIPGNARRLPAICVNPW